MRERPLLDRIRGTRDLERAVPRLPPSVLHRVIDHCGLEDCADLVALTTPAQLAAVLDLDLWRAPMPGVEERFDARRFGVWLETLAELGAETAAERVAALDPGLVTVGLAQHVRVVDPASRISCAGPLCDVGGYVVAARRPDAWDAIVSVLAALDADHHGYFQTVMRGCRRLSDSRPEADGFHELLDAPEQALFELAAMRGERRDARGYVAPEQARALLEAARRLRTGGPDGHDPPLSAIARAYFAAIDDAPSPETLAEADEGAAAAAEVTEILAEEGVLPPPPRALLAGATDGTRRLAHMADFLAARAGGDGRPAAALAFLANVLLSGCSIQDRPFTPPEASDAALAICNLGLENWRRSWRAPEAGDLVAAFEVGWAALYHRVCVPAADRLLATLASIEVRDRDTQLALAELRADLARQRALGTPWKSRRLLDAIAILDGPAWAALLGLLDECPTLHAAVAALRGGHTRAIDPHAFTFIADNRQIAEAAAFLEALPRLLRG